MNSFIFVSEEAEKSIILREFYTKHDILYKTYQLEKFTVPIKSTIVRTCTIS